MVNSMPDPSSSSSGKRPAPSAGRNAPAEASTAGPAGEADGGALGALRERIDAIDDQLQDLLIQRAEVVEAVARVKRAGKLAPLRPGREAQILRRLLGRHRGRFPRLILARIWREILSGTVGMQGDFTIAVQVSAQTPGFWDLARDHYGSHTPILTFGASGEVVGAVNDGRATVGILPLPEEGPRDFWWRYLSVSDRVRPRVIARLPFAGAGNARGNGSQALVIGLADPEPSGDDCGLLALETNAQVSRGRIVAALTAAGFTLTPIAVVPGDGWDVHLFEADDLLSVEDPRLSTALAALGEAVLRVSLLGFYARPLAPALLAAGAE